MMFSSGFGSLGQFRKIKKAYFDEPDEETYYIDDFELYSETEGDLTAYMVMAEIEYTAPFSEQGDPSVGINAGDIDGQYRLVGVFENLPWKQGRLKIKFDFDKHNVDESKAQDEIEESFKEDHPMEVQHYEPEYEPDDRY
jgi:hypothetical protein